MPATVTTTTETSHAGTIARITIDNPGKINVIDTAAMHALIAAFRDISALASLRAVILAGAGEKAFIGGVDISEMSALTPTTARTLIQNLHLVSVAIRACPAPVIARMHGYTLGGGLEIAAACDMRIAAEGAKFGMPETRIGIPSVIEAALLPQLIGWGATRRILLTGEIFGTAEALRWGLVEEVVPAAALDAAIGKITADILACGPRAIRLQKRLMQDWETLPPGGAIQAGIEYFVESWRSPEPAEMMAAFLASKKK